MLVRAVHAMVRLRRREKLREPPALRLRRHDELRRL